MGTEASLTAVGALVLAGIGYLMLHVIGDRVAAKAKEAVFRRASFAARRLRHRALMKTGLFCAALAFLPAVLWLAAATSGREEDAGDARMFAILTTVFVFAAGGLLTTWWRRAGRPQR